MIDFHSHILPGIDDGSSSTEESIQLMEMLSGQGIKTVVATPHFYADEQSVDEFLEKRKNAFEKLKAEYAQSSPEIICGAEVYYYPGISRMTDLRKLCIRGTNLLMLEMPMTEWTEYTVREVCQLARTGGVTVVMAHIERYMKYRSRKTLNRFYEEDILMQVNASFFNNKATRRKALSMMKKEEISFIGSDCHNITTRPPRIGQALWEVEKKLGKEFISRFTNYGYSLLNK